MRQRANHESRRRIRIERLDQIDVVVRNPAGVGERLGQVLAPLPRRDVDRLEQVPIGPVVGRREFEKRRIDVRAAPMRQPQDHLAADFDIGVIGQGHDRLPKFFAMTPQDTHGQRPGTPGRIRQLGHDLLPRRRPRCGPAPISARARKFGSSSAKSAESTATDSCPPANSRSREKLRRQVRILQPFDGVPCTGVRAGLAGARKLLARRPQQENPPLIGIVISMAAHATVVPVRDVDAAIRRSADIVGAEVLVFLAGNYHFAVGPHAGARFFIMIVPHFARAGIGV